MISTRQLRQYDYRGTQDTDGTVLVYGWQMIDHAVSGNSATMLFAPSRQIENTISFNQLRLLSGKTDKRFTLPSALNCCICSKALQRRAFS